MMISKNKHRFIATVLLTLMLVFGGTSVVKAEAQWREDSLLGWVADVGVWEYSPRMGFVYAELSPWVYSLELGWMYGVGGGDVLYWWMPYLDWLLDYEEGYPELLHVESGMWLYVEETSTASLPLLRDNLDRYWRIIDDVRFTIENGLYPPVRRLVVSPYYPVWLRQSGIEGSTTLRITVNEEGRVVKESIKVESSTNEAFNQPTIDAIMLWRFYPGEDAEGNRASFTMRAPFNFSLNRP